MQKYNIKQEKRFIRQEVKQRLVQDIKNYSNIIFERIKSLREYQLANTLFIYLSTEKEVQTNEIIKHSLNLQKEVFVPFLLEEHMALVKINQYTKYDVGKFGIKQPVQVDTFVEFKGLEKETKFSSFTEKEGKIDIAIIPMISFDENLTRLGHGKGYYDRWLSAHNVCKIGLCFEALKFSKLPSESHDVRMDMVITESGIYN